MKKYCVVEKGLLEQHAGSKARCDAGQILIKKGWEPVYVNPIKVRNNVSYFERIRVIPGFIKDWKKICSGTRQGDRLMIQYPLDMYPKVAMLALKYIRKMKEKGVRIQILIHDIDSLRTADQGDREWYQQAEKEFFVLADDIIAHNEKMTDYLRSTGLAQPIIPLGLFDYLIEGEIKEEQEIPNHVVVAGNLSREKAGYIYKLAESQVSYSLYGPNIDLKGIGKNVSYQGSFQPDRLPEVLKGKFGLVWDGAFVDHCGGEFGEYMRYNNPHKTSLYLSCGLPVIVWEEAAVADFVKEHQVGVSVHSLNELPEKLESITGDSYRRMKKNAIEVGNKLRRGDMLQSAIDKTGE